MRRLTTLALSAVLTLSLTGCTDDELRATLEVLAAEPSTTAAPEPPAVKVPVVGDLVDGVVGPTCATSGFGGVRPGVAQVGHHVQKRFGIKTVYGLRAGSVSDSEHPLGLALDFMVYTDRALGDQVAAYLLANRTRFNIKYVIWRQRINYGSGWSAMEDRGSVTANHGDHPHVSMTSGALIPGLTC